MSAKENQPTVRIKPVASMVQIPGYVIKNVLGKGGMATVYLAIQESIGRQVALKVLAPDHHDETFSDRFLREARISSQLSHPNIITVYDAGVHQGHHYMAMEFIDGRNLKQARNDLSRKERVEIVKQVARALDFAGQKGYVHRDIKPENVMLHSDGRAILTDFGIARSHQDTATGLTVTGKAIGTPHYMSPEQTKGLKVDHRSDIYSLGVVLYECLAGYVPYDGPSVVAVGIKHISDPIPQLPNSMQVFQTIINTAMSKDPAHRYQSAGDMLAALEAISEAELDYIEAKAAAAPAGDGTASSTMVSATVSQTSVDAMTPPPPSSTGHRKARRPKRQPTTITETNDYKRLMARKRRVLYLFLLIVAGTVGWIYRAPLTQWWQVELRPRLAENFPQVFAPAVPPTEIPATAAPDTPSPPAADAGPDSGAPTATVQPGLPSAEVRAQIEALRAGLDDNPDNAHELFNHYRQILDADPQSEFARQGIRDLRSWFSDRIHTALEEGRLEQARHMLETLADNFPQARFRDGFRHLEQELLRAETLQLHLAKARRYIAGDALIRPAGANAVEELRAVLAIEPDHAEARQMMRDIVTGYYRTARKQMEAGNLHDAMASVRTGLGVIEGDSDLLSLKQQIQAKLDKEGAFSAQLARAERQIQAGNLLTPPGESAYDIYKTILLSDARNEPANAGLKRIAELLAVEIHDAVHAGKYQQAQQLLDRAESQLGLTDPLAEARASLEKALSAHQPRISQVVFANGTIDSMAPQARPVILKAGQPLHIAFAYLNFKEAITVLEARVLDRFGKALVTTTVIINNARGRQQFSPEIPGGLKPGRYWFELRLDNRPLIREPFLARPAQRPARPRL
ncbi:MAG TPA: serine/threonine protein kinase [Gammaproteobacteria bacterium]|nr:serine/threonine protein kinase [Gammaproteobacteria bacterium]